MRGLDWEFKEWRTPDVGDDFGMIWYGLGGAEGDSATLIDWETGPYGVHEYTDISGLFDDYDPEKPILKTSTYVGPKELADAFAEHGRLWADLPGMADDISAEPERYARWAVSYGAARLEYHGGREAYVAALPTLLRPRRRPRRRLPGLFPWPRRGKHEK